MAATRSQTLRVSQVRSAIGANPKQVATLKALGLGRIGKVAEKTDTPELQGQIRIVTHLVKTEETG